MRVPDGLRVLGCGAYLNNNGEIIIGGSDFDQHALSSGIVHLFRLAARVLRALPPMCWVSNNNWRLRCHGRSTPRTMPSSTF